METAVIAEKLTEWIREKTIAAGCEGVVVGISGGIDSAVVAALAVRAFPGRTLGVIMPCESQPEDVEHGHLVAQKYGFELKVVDLLPIYKALVEILGEGDGPRSGLARANIKPRLRMITLYYFAQERNYLVLGTGNKSELTIGYFTKYGDGGVDLEPIGDLVKSQVRELARYLEVPEAIINKPPSAGLWAGQTDEGEMGLSYEELDRFILTGEADEKVKSKIKHLARINQHKLQPPPIAVL
ncbi:MAG: NAD+ synthase [Syntrophomonadaceae bacterium]|nr:NAD+ synthase [Syntrophomonadaceae bacterium]